MTIEISKFIQTRNLGEKLSIIGYYSYSTAAPPGYQYCYSEEMVLLHKQLHNNNFKCPITSQLQVDSLCATYVQG